MVQPTTKVAAPGGITTERGAPLPGQITQPNPLELYWEKYKTTIIMVAIAFLAIVGGRRGWDYLQRQKRNEVWSRLTTGTAIAADYAPKADSPFFDLIWSPFQAFAEGLRKTEVASFESTAKALAGSTAEALAQWLLACRLSLQGADEATRAAAERAAQLTPYYATTLDYPPIYVKPPEPPEAGAVPPKPEELEPKEPEPSSLQAILLERVKRTNEFRARQPGLYSPPEPDAKPEVVVETTKGKITIRLYAKLAPKHCEQFLKNCKAGVYNELRFHEVNKQGTEAMSAFEGDFALLGDPSSKDDDRSKWGTFRSPEQTPHEVGPSHFPFMLAAFRSADKVGSDQQLIYFTASDCAERRDDRYVVFGRIVDEAGQQVVREICGAKLSTTAEESRGVGKPADPVKVVSVKVVE
jgi:cyclophilin family peptidyl-prolyl cis-trans isomerase